MKESTKNILPSNRREMRQLAARRVSDITKELTEGFKFLENYPQSITFFGGNRIKEGSADYESARTLSQRIVKELSSSIISGGGPGIMEAANRGAFEAGGNSLGLLIKLPDGQTTNMYITDEFTAYYFFVRKVCLTYSAEAFVFFPGGFGTLDEFFEILTLIQTKKIDKLPLICIGSDYWNALKSLIKNELINRETITPDDLELFHITDNHDEVIEIIKKHRSNLSNLPV